MMHDDLVSLTEFITKKLVLDQDAVSVKEYESEDDNINIEIMVNKDDLGKVVGKNGKTINSIRTLVNASALLNYNSGCVINVDSY